MREQLKMRWTCIKDSRSTCYSSTDCPPPSSIRSWEGDSYPPTRVTAGEGINLTVGGLPTLGSSWQVEDTGGDLGSPDAPLHHTVGAEAGTRAEHMAFVDVTHLSVVAGGWYKLAILDHSRRRYGLSGFGSHWLEKGEEIRMCRSPRHRHDSHRVVPKAQAALDARALLQRAGPGAFTTLKGNPPAS